MSSLFVAEMPFGFSICFSPVVNAISSCLAYDITFIILFSCLPFLNGFYFLRDEFENFIDVFSLLSNRISFHLYSFWQYSHMQGRTLDFSDPFLHVPVPVPEPLLMTFFPSGMSLDHPRPKQTALLFFCSASWLHVLSNNHVMISRSGFLCNRMTRISTAF